MNFLGVVIRTEASDDAMLERIEKEYRDREMIIRGTVGELKADKIKLKKDLKNLKYKWMQKLSLVVKKQKKIDLLKLRLENSESNLKAVIDQATSDIKDREEIIKSKDIFAKEYQRIIKCLGQQVNYRNHKIEDLKVLIAALREDIDGTERVAKVIHEKDELAAKVSKLKAEIYGIKQKLSAAKRYIKLKGLASDEDINKAIV